MDDAVRHGNGVEFYLNMISPINTKCDIPDYLRLVALLRYGHAARNILFNAAASALVCPFHLRR